jgi:amino acid efflux transporter
MIKSNQLPRALTWVHGTALAICAVLGCGILILPALTAQEGGPAALIAWVGMSLLTLPLVISLAKLAVIHPRAGGIVAYAALAFGPLAGRLTGWVLLGSVPIGVPAIALTGAYSLAFFLPLSHLQIILTASLIITASLLINIRGIHLTAKAGIMIVLVIISLLLISIFSAVSRLELASFYPTTPVQWSVIGRIAVTIFFCYSGWEMIAPLAEEFKHPTRDIPYSLFLSALLIAILYISLSVVIIGTSVYKENPTAALSLLNYQNIGPSAGALTALLSAMICFASVHANIAGFSRILYAQSREGDLPGFLYHLHAKYQTPSRALITLALVFYIVLFYYYCYNPDLGSLLKFPSVSFLASYIIAMASAIKILPRKTFSWRAGLVAFTVCTIVYFFSGWIAGVPFMLAFLGWLFSVSKEKKLFGIWQ